MASLGLNKLGTSATVVEIIPDHLAFRLGRSVGPAASVSLVVLMFVSVCVNQWLN